MKIVGLTGGIGSGKSTIAHYFKELGVPVYIADIEAKKLMHTEVVKKAIIDLFGDLAYQEGKLNRAAISQQVFKNDDLLKRLNAIVHPAVARHFKDWVKNQRAPYVIKEAAILFESGAHKDCDFIITVTAPKKERVKRVMLRDGVTQQDVIARMNKQWPEYKKKARSTFVITNIDLDKAKKQVRKIHVKILETPVNT